MTKRVMGSVRAELLKMKHTFLIPFHVAVPVIIAGFMLFSVSYTHLTLPTT